MSSCPRTEIGHPRDVGGCHRCRDIYMHKLQGVSLDLRAEKALLTLIDPEISPLNFLSCENRAFDRRCTCFMRSSIPLGKADKFPTSYQFAKPNFCSIHPWAQSYFPPTYPNCLVSLSNHDLGKKFMPLASLTGASPCSKAH